MITHQIEQAPATADERIRNSIGGHPILPNGFAWPECECGKRMVLYVQLDIQEQFGLPFVPGSHLLIFMCPVHNDAPEMFSEERLPDKYWERRRMINGETRFYELFLSRPAAQVTVNAVDPVLVHQRLHFVRRLEKPDSENAVLRAHPIFLGVSLSVGEIIGGIQGFKVGGQPSWAQSPEIHRCCCGAEMRFVCQVPLDWPFPKMADSPEQPDSFSRQDYCLFLGNETYIFACESQCDPRAVHPIVQN